MIWRFEQVKEKLQYLINEIFQIAEEYDSTKTYAVDDYCTYEGKILRCTSATSGAFDSSAWTDAVIVMDVIKAIKARLTAAESNISTAQSDISAAQSDISAAQEDITALNLSLAQTSGAMSAYNGFSIDRYECYKVLGFVIINAQLRNGSTATSGATVIASVPSGFAPSAQYTGLLQLNTAVGVFAITTQGSITCYSSIAANQTNITVHAVYKAA